MLIFQHRRLLHSGDEVVEGVKFTVRSDLMFGVLKDGEEGGEDKDGEDKGGDGV